MQTENIKVVCDTYVSVDLETTGLDPKRDRIIEIGAVKIEKNQIVDRFSSFVNPGRKLEQRITELTGIRDEQLVDAPYIEDILGEFLEFIGDLPILGHSVLFDYAFLKKAAVDQRLSFEKKGMDTLQIARKYLQELEHRNLGYLCAYYHIDHHAHRAYEDALATHYLYEKLTEEFAMKEWNAAEEKKIMKEKEAMEEQEAKSSSLFCPTALFYRVKRDVPATKAQKQQLYKLLEQHKIELTWDVERLMKSEASRLIDQIKSGSYAK